LNLIVSQVFKKFIFKKQNHHKKYIPVILSKTALHSPIQLNSECLTNHNLDGKRASTKNEYNEMNDEDEKKAQKFV